ncbi:trypsin-like peptidase domain-containing protein [Actinoplanes sp. NPDC051513]|uniref:trypsin-like peptidase domain-containing protein n=1 Tax=Actinoplanes sp. NPDC051513 TaxID=3363908 RepID=UPI00379C4239
MADVPITGPGHDPWTVALFAAPDLRPLGCGVLVDRRRVLTCWHVVNGKADLFVTFPKAGVSRAVRRAVKDVRGSAETDVAVLELDEPAPPEATPAPLRSPLPRALNGDQWWAFGFPHDSPLGAEAHGRVGGPLAYGWVGLETRSRYVVRTGFSGSGLWSRDFNAIVGLVGQARAGGAHEGDAQAVTLHQIDQDLPEEKLRELTAWSVAAAGDTALEAWGWSLREDVEAVRHWRPRARGVSIDTEGGYRFRGRTTALAEIVEWLRRARPDPRVLIVTGSPGGGKSAVLGRIVTTSDKEVRAALPAGDHNVAAPIGSVSCAVHVKGKTALDVAVEVARAASVRIPHTVDELVPVLRERLSRDGGRRHFNLVFDALDEAVNPRQARLVVSSLLLPIARQCSRYGAQVIVGSRRVDDGGELLRAFGPGTRLIDLDRAEYFAPEDLEDYAEATLALLGAERPGNPYANHDVAAPVARRIAALADRNFLIAGLIARSHGLYDTVAVTAEELAFTATVDDALAAYLQRLPAVDGRPATDVLTALAYAQAPGLSPDLWQVALEALGSTIAREALIGFVGSSAANFLVETSNEAGTSRYRLFHQALNDALLRGRERNGARREDEAALAAQFVGHGRRVGWARTDAYLLRSLPALAARAGMIDALLCDDAFLLYADLPRLTQLAEQAVSPEGQARARLLRLTPHAIRAAPAERAAMFGVTAELEQLGNTFGGWRGLPYRIRWASAPSRAEHSALEGHAGAVRAICAVTVNRRALLATAGEYRYVRLWDPASGQRWDVPVRGDPVFALCKVVMGGRTLLAAGGNSGTVSLIDPIDRRVAGTLAGPAVPIRALTTVTVGEQPHLAAGADDGMVRTWSLADGKLRSYEAHSAGVRAVTTFRSGGRQLLLSAGADLQVRVWDPSTGQAVSALDLLALAGNVDSLRAARIMAVKGQGVLVTANGTDARMWNLRSGGAPGPVLGGHSKAVRDVVPVNVAGRTLVATSAADGDVRVWDPSDGRCLRVFSGHTDVVHALCTLTVDGHDFLASASRDRTARLWTVSGAEARPGPTGRGGRVSIACSIRVANRRLVAVADGESGPVRLQDVETGAETHTLEGVATSVIGLCPVAGSHELLAIATKRGLLATWDPTVTRGRHTLYRRFETVHAICTMHGRDGTPMVAVVGDRRLYFHRPGADRLMARHRLGGLIPDGEIASHLETIHTVCPVSVDGSTMLATAGDDPTVMLWTPGGRPVAALKGHRGPVRSLATVAAGDRVLLASGSDDQTVRLWEPATRQCVASLAGHLDGVDALCPVTVDDRPMLASGGRDRTVRVWDPAGRSLVLAIPVHHPVLACLEVSGLLFVGLTTGSLALDLNTRRNELAHFREI